jgi:hypothetical protein
MIASELIRKKLLPRSALGARSLHALPDLVVNVAPAGDYTLMVLLGISRTSGHSQFRGISFGQITPVRAFRVYRTSLGAAETALTRRPTMPLDTMEVRVSLPKLLLGLVIVIVPMSLVGLYITSESVSSVEKANSAQLRTIA